MRWIFIADISSLLTFLKLQNRITFIIMWCESLLASSRNRSRCAFMELLRHFFTSLYRAREWNFFFSSRLFFSHQTATQKTGAFRVCKFALFCALTQFLKREKSNLLFRDFFFEHFLFFLCNCMEIFELSRNNEKSCEKFSQSEVESSQKQQQRSNAKFKLCNFNSCWKRKK